MDLVRTIVEKHKAGYPAIYLVTHEDQRAIEDIMKAGKELGAHVYTWLLTKGIVKRTGGSKTPPVSDTENPDAALNAAVKLDKPCIIVLRQFHHFIENPGIQAQLLDIIPNFKLTQRMIVITSPVQKLPPELEKELDLVEMPLPDKKELDGVLNSITAGDGMPPPPPEMRRALVEAATGLTTTEAENAFALAFVRPNKGKSLQADKATLTWEPQVVLDQKCESARKTGILTYYPPSGGGLSQIGGMELFKKWVMKRQGAFTDKARDFGLPIPKGVIMLGPPGTGKSQGAKAMSGQLGLPLIRVDMGAIFGGLVGASEANARSVIKFLEAVAPCVGWLDEIEKGFSGSQGGQLDSGVGARVLGTFLTWMQEKTAPVFIYATANNVKALPPELLRKGRFDEMFSVSLPTKKERKEIFKIHVAKVGRTPLVEKGTINIDELAGQTDGYSGAEIEAVIKEAMFDSFSEGKDLNMYDLGEAMSAVIPLSTLMKAEIQALEEWCRGRTRPASMPEVVQGSAPAGTSRQVSV